MKNVILLSAVLFGLSQTQILIDADNSLFIDGMYIIMGGAPDVEKLVGLHLSMVPTTLAVAVILTVLAAYVMEYIEKK